MVKGLLLLHAVIRQHPWFGVQLPCPVARVRQNASRRLVFLPIGGPPPATAPATGAHEHAPRRTSRHPVMPQTCQNGRLRARPHDGAASFKTAARVPAPSAGSAQSRRRARVSAEMEQRLPRGFPRDPDRLDPHPGGSGQVSSGRDACAGAGYTLRCWPEVSPEPPGSAICSNSESSTTGAVASRQMSPVTTGSASIDPAGPSLKTMTGTLSRTRYSPHTWCSEPRRTRKTNASSRQGCRCTVSCHRSRADSTNAM